MEKVVLFNDPEKGRGLKAGMAMSAGEVVMTVPLLIFNERDSRLLGRTMMAHYVFHYQGEQTALALGLGSIFNHSGTYWNTDWRAHPTDPTLYEFFLLDDVAEGDELLINYGYEPTAWTESEMADLHTLQASHGKAKMISKSDITAAVAMTAAKGAGKGANRVSKTKDATPSYDFADDDSWQTFHNNYTDGQKALVDAIMRTRPGAGSKSARRVMPKCEAGAVHLELPFLSAMTLGRLMPIVERFFKSNVVDSRGGEPAINVYPVDARSVKVSIFLKGTE